MSDVTLSAHRGARNSPGGCGTASCGASPATRRSPHRLTHVRTAPTFRAGTS